MVEKAGAGIACIPEDTGSIASAVEKLAAMTQEERDDMGRRGARYYQQELSLAVGAKKFELIFSSMVK